MACYKTVPAFDNWTISFLFLLVQLETACKRCCCRMCPPSSLWFRCILCWMKFLRVCIRCLCRLCQTLFHSFHFFVGYFLCQYRIYIITIFEWTNCMKLLLQFYEEDQIALNFVMKCYQINVIAWVNDVRQNLTTLQ